SRDLLKEIVEKNPVELELSPRMYVRAIQALGNWGSTSKKPEERNGIAGLLQQVLNKHREMRDLDAQEVPEAITAYTRVATVEQIKETLFPLLGEGDARFLARGLVFYFTEHKEEDTKSFVKAYLEWRIGNMNLPNRSQPESILFSLTEINV